MLESVLVVPHRGFDPLSPIGPHGGFDPLSPMLRGWHTWQEMAGCVAPLSPPTPPLGRGTSGQSRMVVSLFKEYIKVGHV